MTATPRPHLSGIGPLSALKLFEALPWLVLAEMLRILSYEIGGWAWAARSAAEVVTFIVFIIAANRMIELLGGATYLRHMQLKDHLRVILKAYPMLLMVMAAAVLVAAVIGNLIDCTSLTESAPHLMYGFDGIVFDQGTMLGRVWSSLLAVLTLLIVVESGLGHPVKISNVVRQAVHHHRLLLAGCVAVALFMMGLTIVQSSVRSEVYNFSASSAPRYMKDALFVTFVVTFACIRLGVTLAILCTALRASHFKYGSVAWPNSQPWVGSSKRKLSQPQRV